jgi:BirA family transcriptional regulator, biotin operon repressor / biotin---[acetyl-CoA-carboxylase] ligase
VLHRIALPLALALRQFEHEGFAAFADRFAARDLLLGHSVRTTQPDVPEGVAKGVSTQGALLVQTPAGLRPVSSGEVSVRMKLPAASRADATVGAPSC